MLYATNRFPGDGTTTQYEISFVGGYLDRAHVKAYVEGANLAQTPVPLSRGNFLGQYTIRGLAPVPVGSTLVIYRDTPKAPLVDFVNGSRFTESNLDTATRQGTFIAAEGADAVSPGGLAGVLQQMEDFSGAAGVARDQAVAAKNTVVAASDAASLSASNANDSALSAAADAASALNNKNLSDTAAFNAATKAGEAAASAGAAQGHSDSALGYKNEANAAKNAASDSAAAALLAATNAANSAYVPGRIASVDKRNVSPGSTPPAHVGAFFASREEMAGGAGGSYVDMLVLNGYTDGSGGMVNGLAFLKSGPGIYHYQGGFGYAAWNAPRQLAYTDSPAFTGAVTGITKVMVGLGHADDTSDADKPVSTAQAYAIALRYGKNNILGTVSQSAGVPTGAVIERGSNASGEYVRFADGTQICSAIRAAASNVQYATGNIFTTGVITWTFPAAFIAAPATGVCESSGVGGCWGSLGNIPTNATETSFQIKNATSLPVTPTAALTAVGRWF